MHKYILACICIHVSIYIHAVNDMKLQQSARIKAIERKYEQIILDKNSKYQKEIDVII